MLVAQLPLVFNDTVPEWIITKEHPDFAQQLKNMLLAKVVALDCETMSEVKNGALNPRVGEIRLIQLAFGDVCLVADLGGFFDDRGEIYAQLEELGFWDALRSLLISDKIIKVIHNAHFDLSWIRFKHEFQAKRVHCTMLLSQILSAGIIMHRHGLKDVAARYLNQAVDKTEQKSDWGMPLTIAQLEYAATDVTLLLRLHPVLIRELKEAELTHIAKIECEAIPAFQSMQFHGMAVDVPMLDDAIARYESAYEQIVQPFVDVAGDLKPTATPKKLAELFKRLYNIDFAIEDEDDDDAVQVDDVALSKYSDNPVIKSLQLSRTLKKALDYLRGLKEAEYGGRVRGSYRQLAAQGLGRTSCGNKKSGYPNLQNPIKEISDPEIVALGLPSVRSVVRPPKGRRMGISDLSQCHARLSVAFSGDPTAIAKYTDDLDLHCEVASALAKFKGYDWSPEDITRYRKDKTSPYQKLATQLRNVAKNVFYSSLNVGGALRLQQTIAKGGMQVTLDECKVMIKAWRDTYSGIAAYQRKIHVLANAGHGVIDGHPFGVFRTPTGFRAHLHKWENSYSGKLECKPSDVCSVSWMHTEAMAIKRAATVIQNEFDRHSHWNAYMTNFCHDEIDFEVSSDFALEASAYVLWAMDSCLAEYVRAIPVNEKNIKPEDLLVNSWADK